MGNYRLLKGMDTEKYGSVGGITITIFYTFESSISFLK